MIQSIQNLDAVTWYAVKPIQRYWLNYAAFDEFGEPETGCLMVETDSPSPQEFQRLLDLEIPNAVVMSVLTELQYEAAWDAYWESLSDIEDEF